MPSSRSLLAVLLLAVPLPGAAKDSAAPDRPTAEAIAAAPRRSIAELLRDHDGDTVPDAIGTTARIRGVVTVAPHALSNRNFQAFVQDDTGGIALFSYDLDTAVVPGDFVDVRGVVGQYRGLVQLRDLQLEKVGSAPLPEPQAVDVAEADSWTHMGKRVRIQGVAGPLALDSFARLRITGDDEAALSMFVPAVVAREFDWKRYPRGARIAVTGVVSIYKHTWPYDGGFQLLVTRPDDVVVLAPPLPQWQQWSMRAGVPAVGLLIAAMVGFHLVQRRQRARQRELATLAALSTALGNDTLPRDQLARRACEILTAYGIVEAAMVQVFDGEGSLRQLAVAAGDPKLASALDTAVPEQGETAPAGGEQQGMFEARIANQGLTLLAIHPLPTPTGTQGFLIALSPRKRRPSAMQERTLLAAVKLLSLALDNRAIKQQAQMEQDELQQLVIADPLTSLYNRRFLDQYLRVQVPLAKRRGGGLAFLAIDIDHFKRINDAHGHATGDRVLVEIASRIRAATRSSDLPVRLGGEEFLVVVADSEPVAVHAFAERLRRLIESTPFTSTGGEPLSVTTSIGVAIFGQHGETAQQLLGAADQALYAAKRAGRNRTAVAVD